MVDSFADFFQQNQEFVDNASPRFEGDDLFSIFESLESVADFTMIEDGIEPAKDGEEITSLVLPETELETSPKTKRLKTTTVAVTTPTTTPAAELLSSEEPNPDGPQRMSHITVERNRRKQMNEHLSVLKTLMPCFYVKKGDQASIIGGVVEYIKELQQVLQSLEAKKQRKVYSEVLSPRVISSPRPLPMSPRSKPPLSPRLNLPISPRTPQPTSPYSKPPRLQPPPTAVSAVAAVMGGGGGYNISSSSCSNNSLEPSPCNSSSCSSIENNAKNDLVANSKTAIAEVEVKFSGPNVVLKTVSPPIPGQAVKIISALEQLSLEILHVKITTVDESMLNSFTIKIGIECQLSAEELAHQIQQTFC